MNNDWRSKPENRMYFYWSDKAALEGNAHIFRIDNNLCNLWHSGFHKSGGYPSQESVSAYGDAKLMAIRKDYLNFSKNKTELHLDGEKMATVSGDTPLNEFLDFIKKDSIYVDYYSYDYFGLPEPLRGEERIKKREEVLQLLKTANFEELKPNP